MSSPQGVFLTLPPKKHECTTPPSPDTDLDTLWKCPTCGRWWLLMVTEFWHQWRPVRFWHFTARHRIAQYEETSA